MSFIEEISLLLKEDSNTFRCSVVQAGTGDRTPVFGVPSTRGRTAGVDRVS